MTLDLGHYGVWQRAADATEAGAMEVERLGFGALWLGGSPGGDLIEVESIIAATDGIVVATGIINMWRDQAGPVAAAYHRIEGRHPGRLLLGVGIGHPESTSRYRSPLETATLYLDELGEAGVPRERMILAALGPRALRLAADKTVGTHPYFTTPRHTRHARDLVGPDAVIAPEQTVVIGLEPGAADDLARGFAKRYLSLVNYRNSLLREGWDLADLEAGGSDSLVREMVLTGDVAAVVSGIQAHHEAGADHVCIQDIGPDPIASHRAIAAFLGL